MRLKKMILAAIIVIAAQTSYAQYLGDVLRFSQFQNSNTARFDAVGGSKTAIGGDLSSLYGNPAGLGMFSKSEFSLTPGLKLRNNDISLSNLAGNGLSNTSSNLDLNNVGVVFNTKTYKTKDLDKGLISLSFGIGYQKRDSYKNDFIFKGETNLNGLSDFFAQQSNSDLENGVPAAPNRLFSNTYFAANQSELTSYNNSTKRYSANTFADADQINTIKRSGGSSNVDFSLGGNISNKFFFGASVGLSSFRYTSIEKTNEAGAILPSSGKTYNVDYTRNFDTEGSGFNLKLGAILRPTNELRIGASIESPTWYSVMDNYSEDFFNTKVAIDGKDSYPFEYTLRTPLKVNGGLAYFFGSKGFISADLGYQDYSTINFSSSDNNTDLDTNADIKSDFKNTINYSVGGEYKLNSSFLLRAGFQSQGNPYQNLNDKDYVINSYSGGLGYRFGAYYLDLAFINSSNKLSYSNYVLNNNKQPNANLDIQRNNVSLTFGVRF